MMIIHPTALAGIDFDQRSVCGCAPVPEPFDRSPQSAQPDLVRPWSYATRTTRRAFANCSPLCASKMASPSTVRPAAAPPRHEETADRAGVNWKTSIRRIDLMLPLRQLSPAAHPPSLCASHSSDKTKAASTQTAARQAQLPDSRDFYPAAASERCCPVCPTRPKQQASRLQ